MSKQESLNVSFEFSQRGEILQTGRQGFPDRRNDDTERELTKQFQIGLEIFKRSLLDVWRLRHV